MRLRLITIHNKTPDWVEAGFSAYQKRIATWAKIELVSIPTPKRHADVNRLILAEGEKMLAAIKADWVVALNVEGKTWSSEKFAATLKDWQAHYSMIDFLVGGPDGLAKACLERASVCWSLSPLTFPHALVKIILAEQLYRAFSLLHNHPYHR